MIFVDSDAFIAIYKTNDSHHNKAVSLSKQLDEDDTSLLTSWDVIDETATKLSYFTTKKISLKFLERLQKSKATIVYPNVKLFKSAKRIFKKQTSKRVSFTDCVNMAIAKSKDVDTFFSFDKHYEQNGFKLL